MAADVSRQMKSDTKPGPGDPITRDFLGGCFGIESKELDLDLHVPVGWEKRLDLQKIQLNYGSLYMFNAELLYLESGKVYIQRCKPPSPTAPSSSNTRTQTVNFHVEAGAAPNLDLNLFSKMPSNPLNNHENATYQSVCTLDKVKSALERAYYKVSPSPTTSSSKKRTSSPSNSDSSMISIAKNNGEDCDKDEYGEIGMLVAGACPSCLLYVLISKNNPKCPKCNSIISLHSPSKKPKIDLNM
ncbi:hypothetical protein V2J09_001238 [Rumex salicifolius]